MTRQRLLRAGSAGLLAIALVLVVQASWIPAKAWLAQQLLERAWAQTLSDSQHHRPWPWADHWPVARLTFVAQQRSYIVLEGDSGSVLAFAPGHSPKSGLGNTAKSVIISGHRDTHFELLQKVQPGDVIELATVKGKQRFKVENTAIVDVRHDNLWVRKDRRLYLLTCWPFDAIVPGGPKRYLVEASRLPQASLAASPPPVVSTAPGLHG